MVLWDFGVSLSIQTISNKLFGNLNMIRPEPMTCNNGMNKTKRCTFAKELLEHMQNGDLSYTTTKLTSMCTVNAHKPR
ncbi:hypothetical protein C6341_g16398 [Phytophthora cactorum]|nr:hypothetical protein C6341_g16398 [Phytophthora cactorum]